MCSDLLMIIPRLLKEAQIFFSNAPSDHIFLHLYELHELKSGYQKFVHILETQHATFDVFTLFMLYVYLVKVQQGLRLQTSAIVLWYSEFLTVSFGLKYTRRRILILLLFSLPITPLILLRSSLLRREVSLCILARNERFICLYESLRP